MRINWLMESMQRAVPHLLRALGHAVRLVKDDDLMAPSWQRDLLAGEHLDLVAHHVNASIV